MSLADVVAALNAAITSSNTIDLYAASADPALADLRPLLARFTITSGFVVSQAQLGPAATSATLTGQASWGLPGAPAANVGAVAVRLDCIAVADGAVRFVLTLTMATPGWTFGTTFAGLPQTMTVQNLAVKPAPSFLIGARLDNAAFSGASDQPAGLTMTGSLPLASTWQAWSGLVGPWPLQLTGTASLPATWDAPPLLELRATSAGSTIALQNPLLDFGGLALTDVGFGLVSRPPEPEAGGGTIPAFSQLNLGGTLHLGTLQARLTCPLLSSGRLWHFLVEFESGDRVGAMDQLLRLFGLPDLPAMPTPPSFLPVPAFRFDSVEFYIDPGTDLADLTVTHVAASIVSTEPWTSPAPFISLEDVGISWVWGTAPRNGSTSGWFSASVFGTVAFRAANPIHIDCAVSIPGWTASANLREGEFIPIGEAFANYFGDPGPETRPGLNVVGLSIDADPQEQSYYASADILFGAPLRPRLVRAAGGSTMLVEDDPPEQGWTIDLVVTTITLRGLSFHVDVVGGEVSGGIAATFLFGPPSLGTEPPLFTLSAEYPGPAAGHPEGWTFAGALATGASISLTDLIGRFIGQDPVPAWVPQLSVDRLYFRFNSGTPAAYAFGGTISVRWNPEIFGTQLKISAAAALDLAKAGGSDTATGALAGQFTVNRFALSAGLTLGVPEPTYTFRVQFDELWLLAYTSWRDDSAGDGRHQVVSLQLGGVTIGGILEYLVNLAAPTLGYSLDPPWDILNRIELSRFTLTLDPQESVVELVYAANADLVFMRLDTIGVRYKRGEDAGVSLILTGSMLGQRFDGDDLEWDVINESPPPLPGGDETFLELRYLGLGQRIQLTRVPDTVAETLALLEGELQEPKAGTNPLEGQGVEWSPTSQWLIGVDLGLLETVDLGLIFNDPWIYGLSIALGGEKAGSLSGLRFEILYKKISDTVGMFRIELTLPEAFRHFEFGEVSVTLGVVVVEVYTNGNFKIDLGFPYNRNFDRSFAVEVFPFLGRGGIYFGLLNGTTSRRVPKVTNGNFSPVIELGVGLAVGVGKDVSFGPLSGGIYVQVEVIFEGVLGWFHPTAAGGDTTVYYWAQAVAAIHGKLYGKVDFKVIKVSVTLEAYAAATVTLEAYKATLFKLEVTVRAEAEVKVLFIKVNFHFEVDVEASFTVGQDRPTPWILAADQSRDALHAPTPHALTLGVDTPSRHRSRGEARGAARRRMPPPRRRPERRRGVLAADHAASVTAAGAAALVPNWQPGKAVFPDSPRTAHLFMLPVFTLADVPLSWTGDGGSGDAPPRYRFAMQLFAPTGAPPEARNVHEAKQRSAALGVHAAGEDDLDALASDILVRGLLAYALYAIPAGPAGPTDPVTAGQLAWLAAVLDDPVLASPGFTKDQLGIFYDTNIHVDISGQPGGEGDTTDQPSMAMAIPPFLSWTSPQTGPVDFAADNRIGPLYLWGVQVQSARFSPDGVAPPGPPDDPSTAYASFAEHLFSDWNLLVARTAVRDAIAALDNRPLPPATAQDTLKSIALAQPTATIDYPVRPGDTVETVADALGATVDELEFLNAGLAAALAAAPAGTSVPVTLGIAPEVLAQDNPGTNLAKTDIGIGNLTLGVTAGDSFGGLATRYRSSAAAILGLPGQDVDAKLLAPGSRFDAAAVTWTTAPAGCTGLRAAAIFFVRYAGVPIDRDPGTTESNWYSQAVARLSQAALDAHPADPRTLELPPGVALTIPAAYLDSTPATGSYVTVPGDTLARIGAALFLEQNSDSTGIAAWPGFRDAVTPSGGGFAIPGWTGVAVQPGETPTTLARRLVVYWVSDVGNWSADWAGLATTLGNAPILAPLTLVTVPDAMTEAGKAYSFASLATAYGLTLAEVGARLADIEGLVEGQVLVVRHLPADTVESLVDRVAAGAVAGIAGEASRYLLSGQDIPSPVADPDEHVHASATAVSPLFDETRQQWDVAVDPDDPDGTALSIDVTARAGWISLLDSSIVGEGKAADDLALPAQPDPNGAVRAGRTLPPGAIALVGEVGTLTYSYTNKQIEDGVAVENGVPVTELVWQPHDGPVAITIRAEVPVTYGLAQHVALQTPVAVPVPGFDVARNTLSVHPFPPALLARARTGTSTSYVVHASETGTDRRAPVTACTFGALIRFSVRRIVEAPGVYQLLGAEVEQLPQLLALIEYLQDSHVPAGTTAKVATPPSVTAADPNGLALAAGNAWLIKSNLSTETVPNAAAGTVPTARQDDASPLCFADLGDLASFALLLWEGSTVGGIGYTFGIDGGLAAGAFDSDDRAQLELLVISGAQQEPPPATGRTLLPFNSVLLAVDQGIADGATLFAEAGQTDDPTEFLSKALVPAGSTGFRMTLDRPVTDAGEDALRQQYSLVTAVAAASDGAPYTIPASGLPATPQASDGMQLPAWQRAQARQRGAPADPAPLPFWDYQTVLPVFRFGPDSLAPNVPGLPLPADDPYRGLGGATTQPNVDFAIGFGDVLGNRSADADDRALSVPVGYSDPLQGPTGWPAVNSYYAVAGAGSAVTLGVTFAAKGQALMPSLAQRGDAMVEAAKRQRDAYAGIYYQYVQPLTFAIDTTLQTGASPEVEGTDGLRVLAAGGYLTAAGAAGYGAVTPDAGPLGQIVADYGVGWEALAAVNASVPLSLIFGAGCPLTVPAYVVMASGDSADSIAAVPRPGWPAPTAADILTADPNKDVLPLRVGAVLVFPARDVTLPSEKPVLSAFALSLSTSAGWLAADSAADPILVQGYAFTVDGVTVSVGDPIDPPATATVATFSDLSLAFAARGVHISPYQLGESHADSAGMLIPSAPAHTAHYVVAGEATLADNPSGIDASVLADANVGTPDLYEAGTLIYLGDFGVGQPATVTPAAGDRLGAFAARYACPPAALLAANAALAVPAANALAIPGAVRLPASDSIGVPYTLQKDDTLSGIAAGFDLVPAPDKATALATRNAEMTGTVAQGLNFDIDAGGTMVPVDTTGLTSFAAVLADVQETVSSATMADVAAAFEVPGRLATGGLLVCPPARLAAATRPSQIPALYGVQGAAFGLANSGVIDLLVAGIALDAPDPGIPAQTIAAHDTLNSLVGRFDAAYLAAGRKATVTVASMIEANPDAAMFAAGARALVPPADVVLTRSLSTDGPYPGAAFALEVEIEVTRPPALVLDAFTGTDVAATRAPVAAPAASAIPGGSMTFLAFEEAFTGALPKLRLATAKVDDRTADLWAVDFGEQGITTASIYRSVGYGDATLARFIALAPLYRELVTRNGVSIAPLVDGTLDPGAAVDHAYQGIDVEIWASRFLADFDRMLSPAYASAINAIPALRSQFAGMIEAKSKLQAAIPADLEGVFRVNPSVGPPLDRSVTDPNLAAGIAEAQKVLGQALGVSLASAWAIATIIQYDATVDSSWTRAPDPTGTGALQGEVRLKSSPPPPPGSPPPEPDASNPPWRLASTKLSLAEGSPFLTVPMSVSDPSVQAHLDLDLEYAVANIEIHRRPVDVVPGYTRSDWLAMMPVLTGDDVPDALGVDLGDTDVPIPLKAFPALPLILGQSAAADPAVPVTLATAACWMFGAVYSHEHAAQDHVELMAEFNLAPPTQKLAMPVELQDLFTALAQYVAVADDLNDLLAGLVDPRRQVPPTMLAEAVTTFAGLAALVAGLWSVRLPNDSGGGGDDPDDWTTEDFVRFSASVAYLTQSERALSEYRLTRLEGARDWPEVACQESDGSWTKLVGGEVVEDTRIYTPPAGRQILLSAWPRFELSWAGLNTGTTQNGRISIQVVRNSDLLGAAGPATADAFVYRTATVTAPEIVTPAITRTDRIPLVGATVEAALQTAFATLFPSAAGGRELKLTLGLFYGHALTPGPDGLVSELPVGLMPDQTLDDQTAAEVTAALLAWQDRVKPNPEGGTWIVSLAQYSSYDPGKRVLVSVERLSYPAGTGNPTKGSATTA